MPKKVDVERDVRQRLLWVRMYITTGNSGLVCRRCGISRPTLRKWVARYKESLIEGLQSQSRRPRTCPSQKIFATEKQIILELRSKRNLGARRIQNELIRIQGMHLSLATIHKVLTDADVPPLRKSKRKHGLKRYSRPIPGDRVQMDTMKVASGIYQYTAIDDCSRWKVIRVS